MSTHVVYACVCLNIKLYLAHKYQLEDHQETRKQSLVHENSPLKGWAVGLGMGGVVAECHALVRTQKMMFEDHPWMTVHCLNCATDVFSLQNPEYPCTSYPADPQALTQQGEQWVVHSGAVYGQALEALKQQDSYSQVFHMVISPSCGDGVEKEGESAKEDIPDVLFRHHKTFQEKMQRALLATEQKTEARVEQFKKEEYAWLEQFTTKTLDEKEVLWKRMVHVANKAGEDTPAAKTAAKTGVEGVDRKEKAQSSHVRFSDKGISEQLSSSLSHSSAVSSPKKGITTQVQQTPQTLLHPHTAHTDTDTDTNTEEPSVSDSEDMFDLDEEIESDGEVPVKNPPHASWKKQRFHKYTQEEDEEEAEAEEAEEAEAEEAKAGNVHPTHPQDILGSSVPVAIPSSSFLGSFMPTTSNNSFHVGCDLSYSDRATSQLFPPATERRKSLASTRHPTRSLLDMASGKSLDTRHPAASRSLHTREDIFEQLRHNALDTLDPSKEPMVPPHIWIASTYVDEEEELFGAVPRSHGWHRAME
ncbi:hypothetical protein BDF14DRAFT_1887133 [Spinellus fusiger]|nr:hypothetical protein BDF14DRAFT_1887133 [Spinellus fusiger]